MLSFAAAAALGSALVAGFLPALHATRADAVRLLAPGGRGGTLRRSRLRSGLVVLQAALSVLLLVGAGLFVRSLHNAQTVALGYDPDRVAILRWHGSRLDWPVPWVHALYDRSVERLGALPSVDAAAMAMSVPMSGGAYFAVVEVPGVAPVPRPPGGSNYLWNAVSPGYFHAMRTSLLRGRDFAAADNATAMPVAIVTASMARLLWPGEEALGKCFVHRAGNDPPCREVVGVVENVHHLHVEGDPDVMFFIPLAQVPFATPVRTLVVRTNGDPEEAMGEIRRALHDLEPGLPHLAEVLIRHRIDAQLQPWRLGASLFAAFGALALLLAGIGLYAVVSYDVAQRTRELGVRMALGARARNVLALVFGDALRVVVLGLAIGVGLAVWAAPRLEALLFSVAPRDWTVLAMVALLLLAVGALAALLPGRRAVRVQPIEALRDE